MAPRPSSTGTPSSLVISSYWSKRYGLVARSTSSLLRAACSRQLTQNVSVSPVELSRDPHCAQNDCVAFDSTPSMLFMRRAPGRCKDNEAPRRPRAETKPYGRPPDVQFPDNAAVTDGRAF